MTDTTWTDHDKQLDFYPRVVVVVVTIDDMIVRWTRVDISINTSDESQPANNVQLAPLAAPLIQSYYPNFIPRIKFATTTTTTSGMK